MMNMSFLEQPAGTGLTNEPALTTSTGSFTVTASTVDNNSELTCATDTKNYHDDGKNKQYRTNQTIPHKQYRKYKCLHGDCEMIFSKKKDLAQHKKQKHDHSDQLEAKMFYCQYCTMKFTEKTPFEQHVHVCTNKFRHRKPHQCKDCGERFASKRIFKSHKCAKASAKLTEVHVHVCPSCGLSGHKEQECAEKEENLCKMANYIKLELPDSENDMQNDKGEQLVNDIKIEAPDDIYVDQSETRTECANIVYKPGVQSFHGSDSEEIKMEVQPNISWENIALKIEPLDSEEIKTEVQSGSSGEKVTFGIESQDLELAPDLPEALPITSGNIVMIKYENLPENSHSLLRSNSPVIISDSDSDSVQIKQEQDDSDMVCAPVSGIFENDVTMKEEVLEQCGSNSPVFVPGSDSVHIEQRHEDIAMVVGAWSSQPGKLPIHVVDPLHGGGYAFVQDITLNPFIQAGQLATNLDVAEQSSEPTQAYQHLRLFDGNEIQNRESSETTRSQSLCSAPTTTRPLVSRMQSKLEQPFPGNCSATHASSFGGSPDSQPNSADSSRPTRTDRFGCLPKVSLEKFIRYREQIHVLPECVDSATTYKYKARIVGQRVVRVLPDPEQPVPGKRSPLCTSAFESSSVSQPNFADSSRRARKFRHHSKDDLDGYSKDHEPVLNPLGQDHNTKTAIAPSEKGLSDDTFCVSKRLHPTETVEPAVFGERLNQQQPATASTSVSQSVTTISSQTAQGKKRKTVAILQPSVTRKSSGLVQHPAAVSIDVPSPTMSCSELRKALREAVSKKIDKSRIGESMALREKSNQQQPLAANCPPANASLGMCAADVQSLQDKQSATFNWSCPEDNSNTVSQTGRFKCNICLEKFKDEQKFIQHQRTYHSSDKSLQNDNWRLSEQLREASQEPPLVCKYTKCHERFNTKKDLISHRQQRHCRTTSTHPSGASREYFERVKRMDIYICEFCGRTLFGDHGRLALHVKHECDAAASEKCSKCGGSGHSESDCNGLPMKCLKCGDPGYIQHECPVAPGKKRFFKCGHCNATFAGNDEIAEHALKFHNGAKPMKCKFCLVCFFEPGCVSKHEQTHKHVCRICKRAFSRKTCYDKHVSKFHQSFPHKANKSNLTSRPFLKPKSKWFKCGHCKMSFPEKVDLLKHAREAHNSAQPFKCKICSMSFHGKNNWMDHERAHFPHKCKYCRKNFSQKSELDKHVLHIHFDSKPFECTYCSLRFYCEVDLHDHLVSHTEHKPLECLYCDMEEFIIPP